jgi:(5-formylfuran-3-yl)methyl phosphate synthase
MTRMLASVATAAEAGVVVQLGADVVDLRDAREGALGVVSLYIAGEAIAAVAGRSETSAALGNPPYAEEALLESARAPAQMGVDYLKLAVDASTLDRLGDSLSRLARDIALVGVMFADEKPDFSLLPKLQGARLQGRHAGHPRQDSRASSRASRGRAA